MRWYALSTAYSSLPGSVCSYQLTISFGVLGMCLIYIFFVVFPQRLGQWSSLTWSSSPTLCPRMGHKIFNSTLHLGKLLSFQDHFVSYQALPQFLNPCTSLRLIILNIKESTQSTQHHFFQTQPQSSYKKAYLFSLELQPEGGAAGFPQIQRLRRCSQGR